QTPGRSFALTIQSCPLTHDSLVRVLTRWRGPARVVARIIQNGNTCDVSSLEQETPSHLPAGSSSGTSTQSTALAVVPRMRQTAVNGLPPFRPEDDRRISALAAFAMCCVI